MALFKFRKGQSGDESMATPPSAESVDVVRRRARQRLIGAAVLVLVGIIAFPLLFDTQPRPIRVDIPIEIPDRDKAKPLTAPALPAGQTPASAVKPVADTVQPLRPLQPASATQAQEPSAKPASEAKPQTQAKAESKPAQQQSKPAEESAKARTASGAKSAEAAGRYVIQVGAYSDASKAKQARQKVERTGFKTYTLVADTRAGKRIRVRVGPFATRSEADKAASRIKALDLPVAVLIL